MPWVPDYGAPCNPGSGGWPPLKHVLLDGALDFEPVLDDVQFEAVLGVLRGLYRQAKRAGDEQRVAGIMLAAKCVRDTGAGKPLRQERWPAIVCPVDHPDAPGFPLGFDNGPRLRTYRP